MGEWGQGRVGGLALLIGPLLLMLPLLIHPRPPGGASAFTGEIDSLIQAVSGNPEWAFIHVLVVIAFTGMFVGLFSLNRTLRVRGEGVYAPLALYATAFAVPLLLVGIVVDGFVVPAVVASHLAGSVEAQTASLVVIEFMEFLYSTLSNSGFLLLMVGVVFTGASLLRSKLFHPAVSAVGVVVGVIYLVGVFGAIGGLSDLISLVAFAWFILLGALLFRTKSSSMEPA